MIRHSAMAELLILRGVICKMNGEISTISGISPLAKSAQILDSAIARTIVRLVSGCYFGYVFYLLKYRYYPQIELDLPFAIRCGIISVMASGGLFLSSFSFFQKRRILGFTLLLPIFPSLLFVTPGFLLMLTIFVMILIYSYVIFLCRKETSPQ